MAKYCIIGTGFIASALKRKLGDQAHWYPDEDTKVLFYLNGVTHMDFEKNELWHEIMDINEFTNVLGYCLVKNIHVIYPSSALVYEKKSRFVDHKLKMEDWGLRYGKTLGCRIFPVYGPGENKTVISRWCKDIKEGRSPEIYGDGTQKRDFIFIDDLVFHLIQLAELGTTGVVDIDGGVFIEFNEVVKTINQVLGKDIKPNYVPAPPDYSMEGIFSKQPLPNITTLEEGIKKICEAL